MTVQVLKAESARLRGLADKIDELISEIEAVSSTGSPSQTAVPKANETQKSAEFESLTQGDAIVEALRRCGPLTTTELFELLNASGQSFKKVSYVTALLPRLRSKGVMRTQDGKVGLTRVVVGGAKPRQASTEAESETPRPPAA